MERVYYAIALSVGLFFLFSLLGQSIMVTIKIPSYAIVYVDETKSVYYAPPYINGNKYPNSVNVKTLKGYTLVQCENSNIKADEQCVELGYFKEQDTLTHTIGVKLGISNPKPSRWNPDGSWNW